MSKTIKFNVGKAPLNSISISVLRNNNPSIPIQAFRSWSTTPVEVFQLFRTTSVVITWRTPTPLSDLSLMISKRLIKMFFSKFHFCMSTIVHVIKMKVRSLCQSGSQMGQSLPGFQSVLLMVSVFTKFLKSWTFHWVKSF